MPHHQPTLLLNADPDPARRAETTQRLQEADFEVLEAASASELAHLVAEDPPSLILLDADLPELGGAAGLRELKAAPTTAAIPVIWMTDAAEVTAPPAGAEPDGLVVRPLHPATLISLVRALLRDLTERRRATRSERHHARLFRRMFDQSPIGSAIVSLDYRFMRVNAALARLVGREPEELIGRTFMEITHPDDVAADMDLAARVSRGEIEQYTMEKRYLRKDGAVVWVQLHVRLLREEGGQPLHYLPLVIDITERKRQEEQLCLAQKMDAIGRLAGGIAHDLNNLLVVIHLQTELLLELHPHEADPEREEVLRIQKARERASALIHQLLAFSRRQVLQPEVLDLNQVIAETTQLLRPLLGDRVRISLRLARDLGRVDVDRAQMEQVLMNLAVNARDAMPEGGILTLETANVDVDAEAARLRPGVAPGRYVRLAVRDTGTGMDERAMEHLFEPFFTTKPRGRGTGLGLPTVHGIVTQSGGHVEVQSLKGLGTTFLIDLPRHPGDGEPALGAAAK